jgi:hypothetical protein
MASSHARGAPARAAPPAPGPEAGATAPGTLDLREWLRALVVAATLAAFLYLLHELARRRLFWYPLITHHYYFACAAYIVGATLVAGPRTLGSWRPWILLSASVAVMILALGYSAILVGAFALAVCGIARLRAPAILRVAAILGLWLAWFLVRIPDPRGNYLFVLLWAQLAYSSVYLIIEHARKPTAQSLGADLFYLVAFPRLLIPFYQPISPAYLWAQDRRIPGWRLVVRAVLLAAWGVAWHVGCRQLAGRIGRYDYPLRWVLDLLFFYGQVTSSIFVAVAVFRLLGFDLQSGFRAPWLSSSFAEFFRRFNSYVRDAVVSLFYLPLLGWLRGRVPRVVAKLLAGYGAIFLGSFLLNDLLVPAATSASLAALSTGVEPRHVLLLFAFWTAIVVPRAGLIPVRQPPTPPSRWRRALRIVLFDLMWLTFWILGSKGLWSCW